MVLLIKQNKIIYRFVLVAKKFKEKNKVSRTLCSFLHILGIYLTIAGITFTKEEDLKEENP